MHRDDGLVLLRNISKQKTDEIQRNIIEIFKKTCRSMIKSYNKKVINRDVKELKSCNCRVKSECPLNGQCQVTDIIFKCTVLSPDKPSKV